MLSKTAVIQQYLLEGIKAGHYKNEGKLPSQIQVMRHFNCSRTTVLRAFNNLKKDGLIQGQRGSGTFINHASNVHAIQEVIVIGENKINSPMFPFSEMLFSVNMGNLPIRWIDKVFAEANAENFFHRGQAVIWLLPTLKNFQLLDYLKARNIPQLIINRKFEDYDYIAMDPKTSLRNGLSWLLIESGRDIGFITREPNMLFPYMGERIMAFYETCLELHANLASEAIAMGTFDNIISDIDEIGRRFFDRPDPIKGIFVMEYGLVLPIVLCAKKYNIQLGKNLHILTFDFVQELQGQPGLAQMMQPYYLFKQNIEDWLRLIKNNSEQSKFQRTLICNLSFEH